MLEGKRVQVPGYWIADYRLREVPRPRELILLLHGYTESGVNMVRRLEPVFSADAAVLAPNGPFPMPRKTENGYKVGYAWYFYDPMKDEYFIDMELGCQYLKGLIEKLGLADLPTRIVGFSQGGYLAPFFASRHGSVIQVIGVASQFLHEEIPQDLPFRLDTIMGADDDVVSPDVARISHESLVARGARGSFELVPGVGHLIDAQVQAVIGRKLRET